MRSMSTSAAGADSGIGVGTGLAVGGVASVQFGAAAAATLIPLVGASGTVALRLTASAVVLVLLARPWRRAWSRAELRAAATFGAVFTAMNLSIYQAIERLPLAAVITLEFLGPLGVAVVTAAGWATRSWIVPAAAGVVLLGGDLGSGELTGVLFALSGAACWAAYIVLSGRLGRTGTGLAGLSLSSVFGAVLMVPIGLASAGTAVLRPSMLAAGLGVGVLSSAIPYTLDLLALRRLPTAVFGVLTSVNPAVAALAGYLVLGQVLPGRQLAGIALVVLASAGVTVTSALRRRAVVGPAARDAVTVPS
jgi:inner membrane transporter RhtA